MTDTHPAVLASQRSAQYAAARDKEAWLGLFAEDAFLADPVGKSPLDPSGQGHRGKANIEKFWDNVIARANMTMEASQRIPCANTCAAVLKVVNDLGGGKTTTVDMVAIYEVNEDGKLSSLRVHWDWDALAAQLKDFGFF